MHKSTLPQLCSNLSVVHKLLSHRTAGDALCEMLVAAGSADTAQALVVEVTERSPAATWAWRRRGLGDLRRGAAAEAATALQTVVRDRSADAAAWEGLGAAYEATGRLTAALKV